MTTDWVAGEIAEGCIASDALCRCRGTVMVKSIRPRCRPSGARASTGPDFPGAAFGKNAGVVPRPMPLQPANHARVAASAANRLACSIEPNVPGGPSEIRLWDPPAFTRPEQPAARLGECLMQFFWRPQFRS